MKLGQQLESSNLFRRHHAKINPLQKTMAYAKSMEGQLFGPGHLALSEWEALGLALPDLPTIRHYRLGRVREMLHRFDYAGILLYDPINVRYATDTTNMQVWCLHHAARYCFVSADGPVILFGFEYEPKAKYLELIDEVRSGLIWMYLGTGERLDEMAQRWAKEIADLVDQYGGGNRRLAIDRCGAEGLYALQKLAIQVQNGERVMELARAIKHEEEIKAMRCSIAACEAAIDVMRKAMQPGVTEQRLWSYLHAENIARGGEWIETRLLSSGPRTNPWFQECNSRVIGVDELVGFDTDLIGPYGACVDISRTWLCGDGRPSDEQRHLYTMAYEQIQANIEVLQAGMSFDELVAKSATLPAGYPHYPLLYHGVGLSDEYPAIFYPEDWAEVGFNGTLEENMTICVESYVGREGGNEGVKLEEQVLITRDGAVPLSSYPYEKALLSTVGVY